MEVLAYILVILCAAAPSILVLVGLLGIFGVVFVSDAGIRTSRSSAELRESIQNFAAAEEALARNYEPTYTKY